MTENCRIPELQKNNNSQIQEAQQISSRINIKKYTSSHIIVKMQFTPKKKTFNIKLTKFKKQSNRKDMKTKPCYLTSQQQQWKPEDNGLRH